MKFFTAAFPLFLAIFIDGMGLGLFIPILNALLTNPHMGFFTHPVSTDMRHFWFGFTMSIFMLCWFFGAAYLGDLSDAIGRKKSLIIALSGAFLGYLLSAIAVTSGSLMLLVSGRVIAGFTAGSQSVAQAAIVDISPADLKARNIGLILLSASLGFVFGPMCGAFFSNADIFHGFNLSTPLYFTALVSLLNAVFLMFLFKETFVPKSKPHFRFHHAINIFISAFRHEKVRYLSFVLLLMLLGWSSYYSFISMYLMERFHLNTLHIDIFLAALAAGFGIGFGVIVNLLAHRFSMKISILASLGLSALLISIGILGHHILYSWIVVAPIGVVVAVAYSMLLTLLSNQVDENAQGWIMGITNSILAVGFAITGILSALLANWNIALPLWFAASFLCLSGIAMFYSRHKEVKSA